ncbi:hypothetical protein ACWCQ4_38535, partial [Streptomyces aureus]
NYPVDERLGQQITARDPGAKRAARSNRWFMQLVAQARTLPPTALPDDYTAAVEQLRRTGWIVNELFERLTTLGCLKEAA